MKNSRFIKEFKDFAIKGNMVDLAIGIIIGTAFNNVINTIVNKILMPPLALITDGINFQDKKWVLREALMRGDEIVKTEIAIEYGSLITVMVNFFIIAIITFFVVKVMNRLRNMADDPKEETVATPKDIELLKGMRDLMEEQNKLLKDLRDKK